jgi:hypothetical protein
MNTTTKNSIVVNSSDITQETSAEVETYSTSITSTKTTNNTAPININIKGELLTRGESILNNHEFFNDLSELMEDAKFNTFFDKYFTDMNEIKVTLTYMTLYKEFKHKWKTLTDTELDKRINIYLMWKMMRNPTANRLALHTVLKHYENPKATNIFNDIQEFMSISDASSTQ